MKNIITIIVFALFAGTYSADAQEGKTATKQESCCASKATCSPAGKAKCLAGASCTEAEKARCAATGSPSSPTKKKRTKKV
jgi:hypothetical protein